MNENLKSDKESKNEAIHTESAKLEFKRNSENNNEVRLDSNGDEIMWESKRKIISISLLWSLLYYGIGIFVCWFFWFIQPKESAWYYLLALALSIFWYFEIYKALNFKSIVLTSKGLLLNMRFEKDIFYPYGSFVVRYEAFGMIKSEETLSFMSNNKRKIFNMLNINYDINDDLDSFGCFCDNHTFKHFCTQYTQNALAAMNVEQKVSLYKLYRSNIEIMFNEEINHNVFAIDFAPHKEELKKYFYDELQETLEALSIKEKARLYKEHRALFEITGNLQYSLDYFAPYKQEIDAYLKDKR